MSQQQRVVVGLSGGVDSSVTAKLLVDQGYEVIGVFMKNWDDTEDPHCPAAQDAIDARHVAAKLGIPFYTVNFSKEYWDDVFSYFLDQHKKYRTPNPDILCNKYVKFKAFLDYAEKLGADMIATGHYARKTKKAVGSREYGVYQLVVPEDKDKDQTYFLYTLTQEQLAKTLFPLQDLQKSEVRRIAQEAGLETAGKKDSTGICFVGDRDYMEFLKKYLHQTPGKIVTEKGEVIGDHIGLSFYTLGQRRNLLIGGVKGYDESPWFVLEKDIEHNRIVVCQDANNPKLFEKELVAREVHWIDHSQYEVGSREYGEPMECLCKIRYRQDFQECTVEADTDEPGTYRVSFKEAQRAITPGQAIVFYDQKGEICLGGGEIDVL